MTRIRAFINPSHLLPLIIVALVLTYAACVLAEYDYFFLFVLSAAVLVTSFVLMNQMCPVFNFAKMTIPVFFVYTYLAMMFVPAFVIFLTYSGPEAMKAQFLLAVHTVLLSVPIGALLASYVFAHDRSKQESFCSAETSSSGSSQSRSFAIIVLCVAFGFVALFMLEVPRLALIHVLKNPHSYVVSRVLRLESTQLLETRFRYFYAWLKAVIFPFIIIFSLGNYLMAKEKFWFWVFVVSLVSGLFYALLDIQKMPAASIVFTLVLFYLHYKKWKVNPWLFVLTPILSLAIPYLVYYLVSPTGKQTLVFSIITVIFNRLFFVPAEVTYMYFEIFPSVLDFLHGASSRTISFLLGREFFDVPKYVFRYWLGSTMLGHANACFIANAYADWGMTGVLLMGFFAGFVMQLGQILIVRHGRSVLTLTLLSFFMFVAWLLNSIDVLVALNTQGVIISLGFFLLLRRHDLG